MVADMSSISAAVDVIRTGDGPFQARKKDLRGLVLPESVWTLNHLCLEHLVAASNVRTTRWGKLFLSAGKVYTVGFLFVRVMVVRCGLVDNRERDAFEWDQLDPDS